MIYFTFGTDSPYARHYVSVDTDSSDVAREVMFGAHGPKWAFEYDEDKMLPQITLFKLKKLANIRLNQYNRWSAE